MSRATRIVRKETTPRPCSACARARTCPLPWAPGRPAGEGGGDRLGAYICTRREGPAGRLDAVKMTHSEVDAKRRQVDFSLGVST